MVWVPRIGSSRLVKYRGLSVVLTPLRTPRKKSVSPVVRWIIRLLSAGMILGALILLGIEYVRFAQPGAAVDSSLVVAGIPVNAAKPDEAISRMDVVYNQPVELDFGTSRILLHPAEINFQLDRERMLTSLRAQANTSRGYWLSFWDYLWQRSSGGGVVDLAATYDQAKLQTFLQDVATRYEGASAGASFDLDSLSFGASTAGEHLDISASLTAIDAALRRPSERKVALVLNKQENVGADMNALKQAIQSYLVAKNFPSDGPDTVASVVVVDLKSRQEISINPDIAYSAESTIKIPIMLNMFRVLKDKPPSDQIKWLMCPSILCSNNDASNALIRYSSAKPVDRDGYIEGLQEIINTVTMLGAKNTFINAPIDVGDKNLYFHIPPPKTSPDKRFDAKPDPFSQTTSSDMAILLNELYDCSEYGSGLRAAYPDDYSKATCKQMIELLSGNIIGRMIELGMPPGTRLAHKNGWGAYANGWQSSDAGIVYTPGGNYILSIYTWEKIKEGYQQGDIISWVVIEGMSRIVYNYFNQANPLLASRAPQHPTTANNCVMPNPNHPERLSLDNINNGRFDAQGNKLPDACENYPDNKACFAQP